MCGHCEAFEWPCMGVVQSLEVSHVGADRNYKIRFYSSTWWPHEGCMEAAWRPHVPCMLHACVPLILVENKAHASHWPHVGFTSSLWSLMMPLQCHWRKFRIFSSHSEAVDTWCLQTWGSLHVASSEHAADLCQIWGLSEETCSWHALISHISPVYMRNHGITNVSLLTTFHTRKVVLQVIS